MEQPGSPLSQQHGLAALSSPASEQRAGASPATRPKRGAASVFVSTSSTTPRSEQLGESLQKHDAMVRKLKESSEEWEQKMQARKPAGTPLSGYAPSYSSVADGAEAETDARVALRVDAKDRELLQLKDWLFAEKQQAERVRQQYADLLSKMAGVDVEARGAVARLAELEADLSQRDEELRLSKAEVAELTAVCERNQMQAQVEARLLQKREQANDELQRQKQDLMVMRLQEMQAQVEQLQSELARKEMERVRAIDELQRRGGGDGIKPSEPEPEPEPELGRSLVGDQDKSLSQAEGYERRLQAQRADHEQQLSVLRAQLEAAQGLQMHVNNPTDQPEEDRAVAADAAQQDKQQTRRLELHRNLEAEVARLRAADQEAKLQLKSRDDLLARQQESLEQARADIHKIVQRGEGAFTKESHERRFYKCVSDAVVTTALETSSDVVIAGKCFAGETVEALETRTTADGRVRIRISTGWLSVVASNGKILLEDDTTGVLRTRIAEMEVVLRQKDRDAEQHRLLLAQSEAETARFNRELQAANREMMAARPGNRTRGRTGAPRCHP